jgi:hypothetical protein
MSKDFKELEWIMENKPKFKRKKNLTKEQLADPDYRLKFLQKEFNLGKVIGCSKCHHCR